MISPEVTDIVDQLFSPVDALALSFTSSTHEAETKHTYEDEFLRKSGFEALSAEVACIRDLLTSGTDPLKSTFSLPHNMPTDLFKNSETTTDFDKRDPPTEIASPPMGAPRAPHLSTHETQAVHASHPLSTSKKAQILSLGPVRSSVKKRSKDEVGEMERLARELLDLDDSPMTTRDMSDKRLRQFVSRDQAPEEKQSLVKGRKRSLMEDFYSAEKSSLITLILESKTQVKHNVEAKELSRVTKELSRVTEELSRVTEDPLDPGLPPLHPLSPPPSHLRAIDFTKIDFSRVWSQGPQNPASDVIIIQAPTRDLSRKGSNSKGRYSSTSTTSRSTTSRHLDAILSKLVSPQRRN